jgi:hypothetical protein
MHLNLVPQVKILTGSGRIWLSLNVGSMPGAQILDMQYCLVNSNRTDFNYGP